MVSVHSATTKKVIEDRIAAELHMSHHNHPGNNVLIETITICRTKSILQNVHWQLSFLLCQPSPDISEFVYKSTSIQIWSHT